MVVAELATGSEAFRHEGATSLPETFCCRGAPRFYARRPKTWAAAKAARTRKKTPLI